MSVTYHTLTPGKLAAWLQSQPPPKTREEAQELRRVRRLIQTSRDEEE